MRNTVTGLMAHNVADAGCDSSSDISPTISPLPTYAMMSRPFTGHPQFPVEHHVDRVGVGFFREELVADVELLPDTDPHQCFDVRLLEGAEHVDEFLHGPLPGKGGSKEPVVAEPGVSSRNNVGSL